VTRHRTPRDLREAEQSARLAEVRRVLVDRLLIVLWAVALFGFAATLIAVLS